MLGPVLREWLKKSAPGAVKAVHAIRTLTGPKPIEDVVLVDYRFAPDDNPGRRLNVIVPSLDTAIAYGGINTCVEFMLKLALQLRKTGPVSLRFLSESFDDINNTVVPGLAAAAGLSLADLSVVSAPRGSVLSVRRSDIFIAYNWWTSLNIQPVIEQQHRFFGGLQLPKLYFFQDYEPQFYEFSSAHLLARLALDLDWPIHVIFNTRELYNYTGLMGHRPDRSYIIEPRLNPELRKHVQNLRGEDKKKQILVYARPNIPRNCYSIIREALLVWADSPAAEGWEVVSAGAAHRPVQLPRGKVLKPLGKLSISDYGKLLRETSVGISLMASPHPSYPPLEMAHFGIRVLTNSYTGKDLNGRHQNIVSIADLRPAAFADALTSACSEFERAPDDGLRAVSGMEGFIDGDFDVIHELSEAITKLWIDQS